MIDSGAEQAAGKPKAIKVRLKLEPQEEYKPLRVTTIISSTFEHPHAPGVAARDEDDE